MATFHKPASQSLPAIPNDTGCRCSWHALAGVKPDRMLCPEGVFEMHAETQVVVPPLPRQHARSMSPDEAEWHRKIDVQVAEYSERRRRYEAQLIAEVTAAMDDPTVK